MSEAALQIDETAVQAALLARNPRAPASELDSMARFVSIAVDVMSGVAAQRLLKLADKQTLRKVLEQVADQLATEEKMPDTSAEPMRGKGLGEVLSLAEGRARLAAYAIPMPIEEWAGPVGGAKEIEAQFGVGRSTLSTWHKNGAVVGLLRGQRKLAYPLEQFIDGRPLQGLSDVVAAAPDARSAWLWLRQPHGALEGETPLALLRAGKRDQVIGLAARDLSRESD
ncbi:antitoxin Xre/MbcA/ParS toxin-binding domain-containing protein [Porphyrobacter sp. ULC335]|uniref:antitoxin Xre/MbcA/ParS-like domain-containing protein n=1 Tax=Porphyrobacter sp. ULC335 TaxID=2854260 RepID=UPI00221F3E5A|nr:antitoxin Xre/MbcA/ParS toxin-binding domain-containing protein [Porphyrobacter sp. ULC335]